MPGTGAVICLLYCALPVGVPVNAAMVSASLLGDLDGHDAGFLDPRGAEGHGTVDLGGVALVVPLADAGGHVLADAHADPGLLPGEARARGRRLRQASRNDELEAEEGIHLAPAERLDGVVVRGGDLRRRQEILDPIRRRREIAVVDRKST